MHKSGNSIREDDAAKQGYRKKEKSFAPGVTAATRIATSTQNTAEIAIAIDSTASTQHDRLAVNKLIGASLQA